MSGTIDSMIYHPLEKAIEQDFEDDTDYTGRHLGELIRFDAGFYDMGIPGDSDVIAATGALPQVGGLSLNGTGTDVVVSRGYLMRVDGINPSVIGANDSQSRVGLLLAPLTIPIPNPGSDIYFLVQAAVTESILSENRDLFNTTTQAYDPPASITKRKLYRLSITLKQGTATQIPAPDANNVAIGAFFKVNAVALADTDIIDMRPLKRDQVGPQWGVPNNTSSATFPLCQQLETQGFGFADNDVVGRWAAMVNGFLAHAQTRTTLFADFTAFVHSTDTLTAGRWYYIYLGQNPHGHLVDAIRTGRVANAYYPNNLYSNCVVAVSSVKPNTKGSNSNTVLLVQPFEGLSVPAGMMACVGVLRRNDANTGWSLQVTSPAGDVSIPFSIGETSSDVTLDQNSGSADTVNRRAITINLATAGLGGERLVPPNALSVRGEITNLDIDTTGTPRIVQFYFLAASASSSTTGFTGTWNTRERASAHASPFDVAVNRTSDALYLGLRAFTDADTLIAATTAAIGVANRWSLRVNGFRLR